MSYPSGGLQTPFSGNTELFDTQLNKILDAFNACFPIGASIYLTGYSGTTTENLINGIWLEQNGVAVARATYVDLNTLYSGVGYPYGSGDGSTTFNTLDLRGRGPLGHPSSSGNADVKTLGATDGLALASRTPKHTHTGPSHTHAAGSFAVAGTQASAGGATGWNLTGASEAVTGTSAAGGTGNTGSGFGTYAVGGIWVVKAFA